MRFLWVLTLAVLSFVELSAQPDIVRRIQGKWEVETSTEKSFVDSRTVVWVVDVRPDSILITKEDEIGRVARNENYRIDSLEAGSKGFVAHLSRADDKTGTVKKTNTAQFVILTDDGWTCFWTLVLETTNLHENVYLYHRTKKRL